MLLWGFTVYLGFTGFGAWGFVGNSKGYYILKSGFPYKGSTMALWASGVPRRFQLFSDSLISVCFV